MVVDCKDETPFRMEVEIRHVLYACRIHRVAAFRYLVSEYALPLCVLKTRAVHGESQRAHVNQTDENDAIASTIAIGFRKTRTREGEAARMFCVPCTGHDVAFSSAVLPTDACNHVHKYTSAEVHVRYIKANQKSEGKLKYCWCLP